MCLAITTRRDTSRWEKFCHRRPTVSSENGTSICSLADCMHGHGPVLTVVHRPQGMEPRSVPVLTACMATASSQQSYSVHHRARIAVVGTHLSSNCTTCPISLCPYHVQSLVVLSSPSVRAVISELLLIWSSSSKETTTTTAAATTATYNNNNNNDNNSSNTKNKTNKKQKTPTH